MAEDTKLRCVYRNCGEKAEGMLVINTEGGWTIPLPMDNQHADYRGKLVSLTYLENRDPQVQVEYLPEDAEDSISNVLSELFKHIEAEGVDTRRGLWRRLWTQEKRKSEHLLDLMADLLFGLGVPLKVQSPLALPPELRPRLTKLWMRYLSRSEEAASGEEVEMMLDGTVQWITTQGT
jgi:hypothetical protein